MAQGKKAGISPTRAEDFPQWFQSVVRDAEVAELDHVRGCMVIRPWGYGIWELMQRAMDDAIKATGASNAYFPLFIPLNYFEDEAKHVEGFAKEMAVVTHHRLEKDPATGAADPGRRALRAAGGPPHLRDDHRALVRQVDQLLPRPAAADQPVGERRALGAAPPRAAAHDRVPLAGGPHGARDEAEAREETSQMLEVYREFAEAVIAVPVIPGEKPESERFPGAETSLSIEAMMQDGKALQAGTSHYLGTNFSEAMGIEFTDEQGQSQFAHTTSWGSSTRLMGALVMTHADDNGLRLPPRVAPQQVVIVPITRDDPEPVLAAARELAAELGKKNWQ